MASGSDLPGHTCDLFADNDDTLDPGEEGAAGESDTFPVGLRDKEGKEIKSLQSF